MHALCQNANSFHLRLKQMDENQISILRPTRNDIKEDPGDIVGDI